MKILNFKGEELLSDCFNVNSDKKNLQYLTKVKQNLEEMKNNADLFLNNKVDDISDLALLKVATKCYSPAGDNFLDAIMDAKHNGAKLIYLRTDDTTVETESRGFGDDEETWDSWRQYAYEVYANKNFPAEKRIYSKKEIADLADRDIIDVLYKEEEFAYIGDQDELKKLADSSLRYKVKESIFADPDELFSNLLKMDDDKLLKFCSGNKFLITALRSELTDNRLRGDFAIVPSLYEQGQKQFAKQKDMVFSNMNKEKNLLKKRITKYENDISKSKQMIKQIEEDAKTIQSL